MRQLEKRGQFYLIAAVIIIGVLISLVSLNTYKKTSTKTRIYDLGEVLKLESGQVINYGVYNEQDIEMLIQDWAGFYQDYSKSGGEEELYFLYGSKVEGESTNVTLITFVSESSGDVSISVGTSTPQIISCQVNVLESTEVDIGTDDTFTIQIGGYDYNFKLNEGENFFFVLTEGDYTIAK